MTAPRDAAERCRHCGRLGFEAHRQDCPLAPDEPTRDDPPIDPGVCDRAEDRYLNALIGEDPR